MADQHSDTPAEESTRSSAGKSLAVLNRNKEAMSSDDDSFFPMDKKMNLEQLQKDAYYDVLKAFTAESSAISGPRIRIIKELKSVWRIAMQTHTDFENQLKTDSLVQQLRETSPVPAKIQKEKAEPSSTTPEDSPFPGWGDVSPASLVNKQVKIRIDGEDDYVAFHIADYDAETEMHQLVTSPSKKEFQDPLDWIDIRHFPAEDTKWKDGRHPGFPTRKCFLEPGQTILHATSTAREKKQIKEFPAEDIVWQDGQPSFPTRECFLKPGQTILHSTSTAREKNETEKVTAAEEQKAKTLKPRLKVNKEDIVKLQESFNIAPAKFQKEKAEPSCTTSEDPSWGYVSPASLVNKWVSIRIYGEGDYVAFHIADYDADTETHQLVTSPSKKELNDPCSWIDIRHFPAEDTKWKEGRHPGFPTRKCFLKPGQTILHATSTAREKKQIKEDGKTASGIPIIKKLDKGKSIACARALFQ